MTSLYKYYYGYNSSIISQKKLPRYKLDDECYKWDSSQSYYYLPAITFVDEFKKRNHFQYHSYCSSNSTVCIRSASSKPTSTSLWLRWLPSWLWLPPFRLLPPPILLPSPLLLPPPILLPSPLLAQDSKLKQRPSKLFFRLYYLTIISVFDLTIKLYI